MTEFYKTIMGRRYYEKTMPDIAKQLKRIADELEKQNNQKKDGTAKNN